MYYNIYINQISLLQHIYQSNISISQSVWIRYLYENNYQIYVLLLVKCRNDCVDHTSCSSDNCVSEMSVPVKRLYPSIISMTPASESVISNVCLDQTSVWSQHLYQSSVSMNPSSVSMKCLYEFNICITISQSKATVEEDHKPAAGSFTQSHHYKKKFEV